ncbi:TetR/AcrR family transcriptional regulator [Nocardia sp. NPDC058058]|uniref:TetR/AcrR family transcriptional regulator n=1 Tax=Nocardia sp. NPDC058058 TaxID=3346317 RepID=UPI0036DA25DC
MTQRGESRDRMLTGAALLFRERGVAGTALADIMERTGAPRGSVYHYFPGGKAQLAEEATDLAGRTMGRMISALLTAEGPAGAVSAFVDYFRSQLLDSDYMAGCPVAAGGMSGADTPGARERAGEAFTEWESTLASALWQHGMAVGDAEDTATTAVAAIEGALVMARAQRSTRPLDRIETFMLRQLSTLAQP